MPIRRDLVRKVPDVTTYFWINTIFSSIIGETLADTANTDCHLGRADATWLIAGTLIVALTAQFALTGYVPVVYWMAVVMMSTLSTLLTDAATIGGTGIPLTALAAMLTVAVISVFAIWYAVEQAVPIDSVLTVRRESFYWMPILATFVLGKALSRVLAEQIGASHLASALIAAAAVCGIAALYYGANLHATTAFWVVLVLTQSLGASLGDLLSQDGTAGGLAIGATAAAMLIGIGVVGLIWFLTASKVDQTVPPTDDACGPTPFGVGGAPAPWATGFPQAQIISLGQ
jgi:uncharacterized membrane-anchored protein